MNLNKLSAWATIGSFFVGVFALVLVVWPKGHIQENPSATSLPLSLWIFVCALLVAGFVHLAAARIQSRTPASTSRVSDSVGAHVSGTQSEGRIFVGPDITPNFLSAFFKEHTIMQANKMVAIYVGKWMRASGSLKNIAELQSSGILVFFESNSREPDIIMTFDQQWIDRLSVLRPGNRIDAIGKITEIRSSTVSLSACELIEAPAITSFSN